MKRLRSRPVRIALTVATVAFALAWAVTLRPQMLGGPAAYVIVSGTSMEPRLHTGDLAILVRKRSYDVGDVIAYHVPKGEPGEGSLVIHRVVGGSAPVGYVTKGDNRAGRDLWRPTPTETLGAMRFSIPRFGMLFMLVQRPLGLAIVAGLAAFLFVSAGSKRRAARRPARADDPYALAYRLTGPGLPAARSVDPDARADRRTSSAPRPSRRHDPYALAYRRTISRPTPLWRRPLPREAPGAWPPARTAYAHTSAPLLSAGSFLAKMVTSLPRRIQEPEAPCSRSASPSSPILPTRASSSSSGWPRTAASTTDGRTTRTSSGTSRTRFSPSRPSEPRG